MEVSATTFRFGITRAIAYLVGLPGMGLSSRPKSDSKKAGVKVCFFKYIYLKAFSITPKT